MNYDLGLNGRSIQTLEEHYEVLPKVRYPEGPVKTKSMSSGITSGDALQSIYPALVAY